MVDVDYIHQVFPHRGVDGKPSYRRHQFEVIRDALLAFESGIETVVIEAPTGSGKTDIAKTVALYATRDFDNLQARASKSLDPGLVLADAQAHMITSMKLLQDAYLKSPGEVVLLKGKGNYSCENDPRDALSMLAFAAEGGDGSGFSCRDSEIFYGGRGCGSKKCPYQKAKDAAHTRPLALHNFESFLNQVVMGKSFPHQRALITVDEAHNIEDKIINFASVEISASILKSLTIGWRPLTSEADIGDWLTKVRHSVSCVVQDVKNELEGMRVMFRGVNTNVNANVIKRLSWMLKTGEDFINRSQRYFSSVDSTRGKPMKWTVDFDDENVRLEPVQGGRFVREALMKWGRKQLLLSATFLDGSGAYSGALRLRPETTAKFAVPSTFAADRRPIIRRYVGNLGHRQFGDNSAAMVSEIQKICAENPGVRGVVHCTSYGMAEGLRQSMSGDKRFVWHGKNDRESVVREFMSGRCQRNAVLVGVGLTEGYDFAGDLCRFQVLIRIPYPYPSKRLKARSEVDPRHMDWRTCLTMVQTYGRGMRSADDHCRTYVLDSRFDKFVKTNVGQLPAWFREAIR